MHFSFFLLHIEPIEYMNKIKCLILNRLLSSLCSVLNNSCSHNFFVFQDSIQCSSMSNVVLWHNPARSHLESFRQRRWRHGRVDADDVARVAEQPDDHCVFSHHHCLHHSALLDTCGNYSCLLLSHSKVRPLYYSLLDTCGSDPGLYSHSKVTPSLLDICCSDYYLLLSHSKVRPSLLDTCGSDSCLLLSRSTVRPLNSSLLDTCGSDSCFLLYHSIVRTSLLDTCGTDSCLLLSHSKVGPSLLNTCGSDSCLLLSHSKVTPDSLLDTCGSDSRLLLSHSKVRPLNFRQGLQVVNNLKKTLLHIGTIKKKY